MKSKIVVTLLLTICVVNIPVTFGQGVRETRRPNQKSQPESHFRIYHLKYVAAKEGAAMLTQLMDKDTKIHIVADLKTNTILVNASKEKQAIIEAILLQLDTAKTDKDTVTEFLKLQQPVDEFSEQILRMMQGELKVDYIIDAGHDSVFVRGKEDNVKKFIELFHDVVTRMQQPPQKNISAGANNLRIVWLKSGHKGNRKLPENFNAAVESLRKVGVDNLGMVTQVLVNVGSDNKFSIQGSSSAGEISVRGSRMISQSSKQAVFELIIEASGDAADASVETAVSLISGQMVVLGVAPSGEAHSVFLVELVK